MKSKGGHLQTKLRIEVRKLELPPDPSYKFKFYEARTFATSSKFSEIKDLEAGNCTSLGKVSTIYSTL